MTTNSHEVHEAHLEPPDVSGECLDFLFRRPDEWFVTYIFQNCFSAAQVSPYLLFGTVLDNQKCVSVRGTFLQNPHYMEVFYREGYTDIEMEAGPYLSAVYEMFRPQRHPVNEIINLYEAPFDIGIIHYVSDNPMGKGKNLGTGSLSYYGMDSTYASSVAILRQIFKREKERINHLVID